METHITVRGARLHNLKNISVSIPKNRLVVLTGLSGSGKSTLGFDILLKEGQRQYMESLGMIAFGMAKAPVDSISGLSPSISVDQHLANQSPRSTVGTATDIYTYLRVLFARLGQRACPACGKGVAPSYHSVWAREAPVDDEKDSAEETFPCPHCDAPIPELGMAHFSFNKPAGACPSCTGLGKVHQANLNRLVDEQKSLADGAVAGWDHNLIEYHTTTLQAAANYYGFEFDRTLSVKDYPPPLRDLLFYGVDSPVFRHHIPQSEPPAIVRRGRFEGIATNLLRRHAEHLQAHIHEVEYRDKLDEFLVTQTCPDCLGTRLRPESRAVTVNGRTIIELSRLSLTELGKWLNEQRVLLGPDETLIAGPILDDLLARIDRLDEVGAGYLTLERPSPSISAGEAQRLRLAALLGSGLSGVLYVCDEPTIGLHQRDTRRLITNLRRLRDLGNTVLVIEHDLEMIAAADYVIDLGPCAGKNGGQVMAAGIPAEVAGQPGSLTGAYLARRAAIRVPAHRRTPGEQAIVIYGARHHNLRNIDVRLPLGVLTAVTGVSGSGKSTLVFDILDRALSQHLYGASDAPGEHDVVEGWESINQVITIDQQPIGRVSRSNVATYSEVFNAIRAIYAAAPEARQAGFTARTFSLNAPGGRCDRCEGAGVLAVKMYFLPDAEIRCPGCYGRRYDRETLAVKYGGLDIAQALDLTVEEALETFKDVPSACSRLQALADVGLGYLQLGQPAPTLSGGEAQRVKLAKELGRRSTGRTLYLLDEPTTGLHLANIAQLLGVLQRLVDAGNSVIFIEHNLELIKAADWVIDLGPEGGAAGGKVIAEGTPEKISMVPGSLTGQGLREIL